MLIALNKKFVEMLLEPVRELPSALHGTLNKVDENAFPVICKSSKLLKLLMLIPATAGTVERA